MFYDNWCLRVVSFLINEPVGETTPRSFLHDSTWPSLIIKLLHLTSWSPGNESRVSSLLQSPSPHNVGLFRPCKPTLVYTCENVTKDKHFLKQDHMSKSIQEQRPQKQKKANNNVITATTNYMFTEYITRQFAMLLLLWPSF